MAEKIIKMKWLGLYPLYFLGPAGSFLIKTGESVPVSKEIYDDVYKDNQLWELIEKGVEEDGNI